MVGPLLEGKFHVPGRRPGAVARPRLSERLSGAMRSALTLVSAPAGFGKTTLLTEWLATAPDAGRSVAWLSLGARDNDPTLYWTYVVAALQTAADGVGASALSLLQSSQPSTEAAVATLLNDLHAIPEDIVLVLDDYHVIEAGDVLDGMAFLLEHLPPKLHLVIATRADPALALARMRGRGELLEVRAADLRFTTEESAAYLNGAMGVGLTAQDVAALDGRTEGWIAALQLAALSMQGRDDVSAFIAGFAGDDRYIVDYLAEEVLQRQPADVREFLLRTSILDRLGGLLCDAVTGRAGGNAELAALERGNLFLVPLDDRRRWYRYHQLFADVLQAHLTEQHPGDVPDLHRRASAWYEQNGEPSAAVRHALAAGDVERAASLIELAIPALQKSRQEATIRGWLDAIPDEVVRVRPVLAMGFIGALISGGEFEGVERRLRDVERLLEAPGEGARTPPRRPSRTCGPCSAPSPSSGRRPSPSLTVRRVRPAHGPSSGEARQVACTSALSDVGDHCIGGAGARSVAGEQVDAVQFPSAPDLQGCEVAQRDRCGPAASGGVVPWPVAMSVSLFVYAAAVTPVAEALPVAGGAAGLKSTPRVWPSKATVTVPTSVGR